LEYGTRRWNEAELVADHIFSDMIDETLLDNPAIIHLIDVFRKQLRSSPEQLTRNFFIYHPDTSISALAVSLLNAPYEASEHWRMDYSQATGYQQRLFEQDYDRFIQLVARDNDHELMNFLKADEDKTHVIIESTLNYLKLRKIKRLLHENHEDMEKKHSKEEQEVMFRTHYHLKQMEKLIAAKLGTVILR
jgi:DNA primase